MDKFTSFLQQFKQYNPTLVECIQHGYNVIYEENNKMDRMNLGELNWTRLCMANPFRAVGCQDIDDPYQTKLTFIDTSTYNITDYNAYKIVRLINESGLFDGSNDELFNDILYKSKTHFIEFISKLLENNLDVQLLP